MQHSDSVHDSWTYNGQGHLQNAAGIHPTPPESSDGVPGFPSLVGLTEELPTPAPYDLSALQNAMQADYPDSQVMSISTSFHPGAHSSESDLIISSSDGVLFYVHSTIISATSPAAIPTILRFSTIPGTGIEEVGIISIPLNAVLLNIIFHTIYGTSCAQNNPSVDDLIAAVDVLPELGIAPRAIIQPKTPLFTLLLSHAPMRPLDVFAVAAHHDLAELASTASSHLLSFPLFNIDDTMAARIGTSYLKRLFLLHMMRMEEVKMILAQPPALHPIRKDCDFENQKKLSGAWAWGTTCLAWDLRPDLPTQRIRSVFEPLSENLTCTECQQMLKSRIRDAVRRWASIKTHI
ncbi:hypothetical protein DFP72DRAFT_1132926 [Ephemerocybe angulata]|uniref:BTB domain-containing protein n=1 Tax=Ephemerocybe angulata TaxID=980116 RepID=A0A8H6HTQ1_9AGAR|nr:hypothetical protein DFP72DRAFT_1132926 [Tulosesus angulatus]